MLRIGVIGAGRRGRISKLAHQPDSSSVLVAACDTRAEIRDEYQREYDGDFFVTSDYRQLLARDNIDAVFVTSPDFLHEEHALAVIESGRSVYLEKPMAITIEGCDRILGRAQRRGVKLYVGHNLRFAPVFVKMKELIDAGTIGQVEAIWCRHFIDYGGDAYFKDWHSEQRYTCGLLLQKASRRAVGLREQGDQEFTIPPLPGEHGGSDPLIVNDFIHFLRTGQSRGARPWDARMSVATGCMATRSLREGSAPRDVPAVVIESV